MFIGNYQHSLDAKGRVIIPSKHREELGEKFMMTQGLDKCIYVYPLSAWERIVESVSTIPMTDKDGRAFIRFFFSNACECSPDKQGRVLVDSHLREYAGLTKDVTIIGSYNRIEIWDDNALQEANEILNENPDEFTGRLAEKYGV